MQGALPASLPARAAYCERVSSSDAAALPLGTARWELARPATSECTYAVSLTSLQRSTCNGSTQCRSPSVFVAYAWQYSDLTMGAAGLCCRVLHIESLRLLCATTRRSSCGPRQRLVALRVRPACRVASTASDSSRLTLLRAACTARGVDALIVPANDPHLAEYPPLSYHRRAWLTGFNGSAGFAAVTQDAAALWTDGRYTLQADLELNPRDAWELHREGTHATNPTTLAQWLAQQAERGCDGKADFIVGVDPSLHSHKELEQLKADLADARQDGDGAKRIIVAPLQAPNLIDALWEDRPPLDTPQLRVHSVHAGKSIVQKLQELGVAIRSAGACALVVSELDEVAYLCNVRCWGQIPNCPTSHAYVLVTCMGTASEDEMTVKATLFIRPEQLSTDVLEHLAAGGVQTQDYGEFASALGSLSRSLSHSGGVLLDPARSNAAIYGGVVDNGACVKPCSPSPLALAKACKNHDELAGMRACHAVDGAALVRLFAWLEEQLQTGVRVEEVDVVEAVADFRRRSGGASYLGESFHPISGSGPNGAIVHYRANRAAASHRCLVPEEPFLFDSGGQYLEGTTDVTRTFHFGEPTAHHRQMYSRVLQGHIALDTAQFPVGTPAFVLDAFARRPLWDCRRDYAHGTGHGVGAALHVHEGPAAIAQRWDNTQPLRPGMVVSCEPGYYEPGEAGGFGIRIENLLVVVDSSPVDQEPERCLNVPGVSVPLAATQAPPAGAPFLKFERLTYVPIQTNMLLTPPDESCNESTYRTLLTESERCWLDDYHAEVWGTLAPQLQHPDDRAALEWLRKACAPLPECAQVPL